METSDFSNFIIKYYPNLQLRINHQWPSGGVLQNSGILRGHSIHGKTLVVPGGYLGIIREKSQGIHALGVRDVRLFNQNQTQFKFPT